MRKSQFPLSPNTVRAFTPPSEFLAAESGRGPAPDRQAIVERLLDHVPELQTGQNLGKAFLDLVRQRQASALEPWLGRVDAASVPEFQRFAQGLRQDNAAVLAALTLPWSNGQVEGQVNRLKCLKRQMYGRASLELLRARVLNAP